MFKRGLFKKYCQKLTLRFNKYYGIFTYHDLEPEICIKTSLLGKTKIVVPGKDSRLEKVSKEEMGKALEKLKIVRKNSEELENRI